MIANKERLFEKGVEVINSQLPKDYVAKGEFQFTTPDTSRMCFYRLVVFHVYYKQGEKYMSFTGKELEPDQVENITESEWRDMAREMMARVKEQEVTE